MQSTLFPSQSRRAEVTAVPIILADGNAWSFAEPSLTLFPIIVIETDDFGRHIQTVKAQAAYGYPPDIQSLCEEIARSLTTDAPEYHSDAFIALASALLRRAHAVDQSTAVALLAVDLTELPRLVQEVMNVAFGARLVSNSQTMDLSAHDIARF
jgi:hypothetical protein